MIIHTIETATHGRFLVDPAPAGVAAPMLVGFHGYAETAEIMMDNLRAVTRGGDTAEPWCLVSVQALHRFYTRQQEVVANWMTRQDRELEIAANRDYVWSVVRAVQREYAIGRTIVFAGFSQGVAMAYRAASSGECAGLVVLAGDVPPDVAGAAPRLPPVLLGRGTSDEWYSAQKAAADVALLRGAGVTLEECVFDGGHVWDDRFSTAARRFLASVQSSTVPN